MTKDVSIILVSYNTKDMTRDCIKSVYEKTQGLDYDIWIVDNDSKDGSADMIKEEFPEINLIANKENLGFGMANNLAIEKCDAKYAFLLNTDTLLINNAIKIMFDFMEKTPKAGACGGNLYDGREEPCHSYGHIRTIKTKIVKTLQLKHFFPDEKEKINDKGNNDKNEFKKVGFITGADLMMRKDMLDKIGGFDKDFFLYYEETELQYRIHQAGYDIYILPEAKIIHLAGKSSSNKVKKREYFLKSEYLFYKKCYGLKPENPATLIFLLSHLGRLITQPAMILRIWKYIFSKNGGIRE